MSIKHLIIDTNYILSRVQGFGAQNVYATPDVIAEIRDEQSIQYLQSLEYFQKIKVRQPTQASIKRICEACIAMGELGSLSRQDCGVLALALDICEEHIPGYKIEPVARGLEEEMKSVFYDSNALSKNQLRKKEEAIAAGKKRIEEETEEKIRKHLEKQAKKSEEPKVELKDVLSVMCQEVEPEQQRDKNGRLIKQKKNKNQPKQKQQVISKPVEKEEKKSEPIEEDIIQYEEIAEEAPKEDEDQGWDSEWVTSDNIEKIIEQDMTTSEFTEPQEVCVFTLDKAMQNVAMQLKLPLVAPSGKKIERITRYALKCSACCAVFTSMEPIIHYTQNKPFMAQLLNEAYDARSIFCPSCGSVRLMKVAAYFDGDRVTFSKGIKNFRHVGQQNYCDLTQKQFSSLRQKYLLHPELYHDRLVRVITEKPKHAQSGFTDDIQGVSGNVKGDEVAYFLRRGRKGVKFGAGLK